MSRVLESGDIFFIYRPRIETDHASGLEDVQRFFVVVKPENKEIYRRIVIGRKYLSETEERERNWGFVDKVTGNPDELDEDFDPHTYRTRTRGERWLPAARPAGEGVYAIIQHDGHTHLAYKLELPRRPGKAQQELKIAPEASYVMSVKNPETGSPRGVGLSGSQKPEYPKHLQDRFEERRFVDLDPPDYLDHEGAEIVLIGASENAQKELGVHLPAQKETEKSADTFTELHLEPKRHPTEPLTGGEFE